MRRTRLFIVGFLLGGLLAVLLGGCALLGPDAKVIDALGKANATMCISATTPYGVVRGSAANCVDCNVTCAQDGSMAITAPGVAK